MKLKSISPSPTDIITELCFLETTEELNSNVSFDACIICGSNDPMMMDKVAELHLNGRLINNIVISGHQAPVALTDGELENYEALLPLYEAFQNKAKELGIPTQDVQANFVKKIDATKRTLGIRTFEEPEYQIFKDRAIEKGVNSASVLLEKKATNAKENIDFSMELLDKKVGLENIQNILIVAKSFMMRRVELTLRANKSIPDTINYVFLPYASEENPNAIHKDDWYKNEVARKRVLDELVRLGQYTNKGDLSL